nr:MAG: hypothetical protein DIU70_09735 [Bacillota bacterium]
MVEIARVLSVDARVLILDEPTAALTQAEAVRLFAVLDGLRARGVGIVYISHRLEELYRLCDRVTVIRDGVYVGTYPMSETPEATQRELAGSPSQVPDSQCRRMRGLSIGPTGRASPPPYEAGAMLFSAGARRRPRRHSRLASKRRSSQLFVSVAE